jgi:hypothetical protein
LTLVAIRLITLLPARVPADLAPRPAIRAIRVTIFPMTRFVAMLTTRIPTPLMAWLMILTSSIMIFLIIRLITVLPSRIPVLVPIWLAMMPITLIVVPLPVTVIAGLLIALRQVAPANALVMVLTT